MNDWPRPPDSDLIQLWFCPDITDRRSLELQSQLSQGERERVNDFRLASDRLRYIGARLFLRCVIARNLKCEPKEIQLDESAGGLTTLEAPKGFDLHFSVSTSQDLVLIALSCENEDGPSRRVGIDLERRVPSRQNDRIAHEQFSEPEQRFIRQAADPTSAFFQIWTGKEAYRNASGPDALADFDFSAAPKNGAPVWSIENVSSDSPSSWRIQNVELPTASYCASLVHQEGLPDYELIEIGAKQILNQRW